MARRMSRTASSTFPGALRRRRGETTISLPSPGSPSLWCNHRGRRRRGRWPRTPCRTGPSEARRAGPARRSRAPAARCPRSPGRAIRALASAGGSGAGARSSGTMARPPPATSAAAIRPTANRRSRERPRRRDAANRRGAARSGTRNLRERYRGRGRRCDLRPGPLIASYQSNFAPKRKSRGGMIVVGCRKFAPEPQLMFWAALVLVRL